MLGQWRLTVQSHVMNLNKVMDSSQEKIIPEKSSNPESDAKEPSNTPKQEPRPSLLDSLLKKNSGGKKLRFLKKEK